MVKDEVHQLTVSGLVDTLGPLLIRPLTGTVGLDEALSVPVVYDRLDELPVTPAGVLLLIGLSPSSPESLPAIELAAARGFSAAVIKARDVQWENLAAAAAQIPIALLGVADDVPWRHVSNLITAMTATPSGPESSADASGSDLFVLANAVATAVGGAVAIEDLDRNLLAYSNLERQDIDEVRQNGILARQVPDLTKHYEQYRTVLQTDGVSHFPFDPSDGELPRYAAAVRAGKEALGSIWVIEGDTQISREGEAVLLKATRLAAVHILRARSSVSLESQMRAEWFRSLLDGSGFVRATAARFGLTPNTRSVVIGFMFQDFEPGDGHPLVRQLTTVIEEHCGIVHANVCCASIGPIVYLLLPAVQDARAPRRLAEGAVSAVAARLGHKTHAAISSSRTSGDALLELRHEVDEILQVLFSHPQLPAIADVEDVHSQLLLMHLKREVNNQSRLQHKGVSTLVDHDRNRGTDYRNSLCAYFSAMGDVGVAARELNVHPNTLRYRIKRATSLFNLSLDGPDDRLAIWLCLRLEAESETSDLGGPRSKTLPG